MFYSIDFFFLIQNKSFTIYLFLIDVFSSIYKWLSLLLFGEGWHNNHHAFQHSPEFGLKGCLQTLSSLFAYPGVVKQKNDE